MGKSHSAAAGWKVRAIRFAGWDGFSHFESFLVLLGDSIFINLFQSECLPGGWPFWRPVTGARPVTGHLRKLRSWAVAPDTICYNQLLAIAEAEDCLKSHG